MRTLRRRCQINQARDKRISHWLTLVGAVPPFCASNCLFDCCCTFAFRSANLFRPGSATSGQATATSAEFHFDESPFRILPVGGILPTEFETDWDGAIELFFRCSSTFIVGVGPSLSCSLSIVLHREAAKVFMFEISRTEACREIARGRSIRQRAFPLSLYQGSE